MARRAQRHQALERESPRGAQPTGLPAGVETRCPERARVVRRAPARPEWSVASDAEGGSGARGVPSKSTCPTGLDTQRHKQRPGGQKGRGRLGRPPTPQAPQERGAQRGSRDAERPRAFRVVPTVYRETTRSVYQDSSLENGRTDILQHWNRPYGQPSPTGPLSHQRTPTNEMSSPFGAVRPPQWDQDRVAHKFLRPTPTLDRSSTVQHLRIGRSSDTRPQRSADRLVETGWVLASPALAAVSYINLRPTLERAVSNSGSHTGTPTCRFRSPNSHVRATGLYRS